jgi:hypothetical protein
VSEVAGPTFDGSRGHLGTSTPRRPRHPPGVKRGEPVSPEVEPLAGKLRADVTREEPPIKVLRMYPAGIAP